MNEKEEAMMEAVIKKRKEAEEKEKRKKAEEKEKREKSEDYSKEDLEKLLVRLNATLTQQDHPVTTTQPSNKKQPTQQQQIAYSIWKDAKATSIVCLIAIVLPFITILIAMWPGGEMFAMIIALAGIMYPCFVFVKSIFIQTKIHKKYGLKPLFKLPQQQIPQQHMNDKDIGKGEMF